MDSPVGRQRLGCTAGCCFLYTVTLPRGASSEWYRYTHTTFCRRRLKKAHYFTSYKAESPKPGPVLCLKKWGTCTLVRYCTWSAYIHMTAVLLWGKRCVCTSTFSVSFLVYALSQCCPVIALFHIPAAHLSHHWIALKMPGSTTNPSHIQSRDAIKRRRFHVIVAGSSHEEGGSDR